MEKDGVPESESRDDPHPWHRLFGVTVADVFHGSSYEVELEKDLSLKKQYLDVVIIERRHGGGTPPESLPDGLENLGPHNLVTFKSHREPLDGWTVDELIGHYVNYRKQISPSRYRLLPEEDFRLYAVSARFPEKMAKVKTLKPICEGVYEVRWGIRHIRLIVLSRISDTTKNAPWLLFSAVPDKVKYGADHYRWKSQIPGIISRLFKKYSIEGVDMPYSIEDFQKEIREDVLKTLTPEERLKGLTPEEIFKRFKPEDRVKGLRPEDRLKGLRPEDRLKGLRPEEIEAYLKKIGYKADS